ncbi:fumarylacetoacetate hydrolase family protein [Bacillus infantis]|uniref:fumarylacetoacetate hydrolase family protein n=1 Tax=Bacillus infantis TaxID=324767 RepID=UPI002FBE7F0F
MRFATAEDGRGVFIGVLEEGTDLILPLAKAEERRGGIKGIPESLLEAVSMGEEFVHNASELLNWAKGNEAGKELLLPLESVKLLAPIPNPVKNILCVGKNYAEHAIEMGSKDDIPEHIMVFTKAPTSVSGPEEEVLSHAGVTEQLDYEGELAVVIGKAGRGISEEEALSHVFGYTIINDVTARDLQAKHKQFFIGKSLDSTCPMGPWIVHKSAIENPGRLDIETKINGEVRQSSNTENFIFPIEVIISELSKGMTLEPGDIIATGTPAGVGKGFKPPRFLNPGDVMEVTVEKIGTLRNRIEG